MKNFIKYSAFLLIIMLLASCLNNTTEDTLDAEIKAFGLFPAGNDQYTILASKSVDIENTWETNDSLVFIKIDSDGNLIV